MSLQICPQCGQVRCTWYVDDDGKDRWSCWNAGCDYDASDEAYLKWEADQKDLKMSESLLGFVKH